MWKRQAARSPDAHARRWWPIQLVLRGQRKRIVERRKMTDRPVGAVLVGRVRQRQQATRRVNAPFIRIDSATIRCNMSQR